MKVMAWVRPCLQELFGYTDQIDVGGTGGSDDDKTKIC